MDFAGCLTNVAHATHRPGVRRQSRSSMTMNRPAANFDDSAAARATVAEHGQTDYFLGLLTQICRRINHRVDKHQRASAIAEASGHADYACGARRMARIEDEDRQIIEGIIDHLQRGFPLCAPGEVPRSLGGHGLWSGLDRKSLMW